jgi:hypothetical protein
MGRLVTPQPVWRTPVLCAALWVGLAGCSGSPGRAPPNKVEPPVASDEMGEAHDQSAFVKDPSETHLMSPDEPDLHPQPEPGPPDAR